MFVDSVIIDAAAGQGGNGCHAFRRESFIPKGGPSGGDGGRGGDIVLETDENVSDLRDLKFKPLIRGKAGGHGRGSDCHGRNAKPVFVKVPPGTVVYRLPGASIASGARSVVAVEEEGAPPEVARRDRRIDPERDRLPIVQDLSAPGLRFVLCHGGRGGRGNAHFKTSTNRSPQRVDPGEEGEEGRFYLELKTIADFGLVGFPNAGKSTLLRALSSARPKVAPYPFTTLVPHVGVVETGEDGWQRFTVADVPGLIEGAHRGVGLGHDFLRHIERCRALIFVLDMAGSEGRDAVSDFKMLQRELRLHGRGLVDKSFIVVANKMDMDGAEKGLKAFRKKFACEVFPVSAELDEGVPSLKVALAGRMA